MNKIKLFCFPYAGGSAIIYNDWKPYLDTTIELRAIELAGRGSRIQEPFYKNVPEMIEDVFQTIKVEVTQSPYAFFGHSMGCIISYELAHKMKDHNLPPPLHLFFSGRGAPHIKRRDNKKYHLMNDSDFKKAVIELGGTPPELFEHTELLKLFLPLLKSDFKMSESEIETREIRPLDCNITGLFGMKDDLTQEQCEGWKQHTKQLFEPQYFEGGHFFLHQATKQIVTVINDTLNENSYYINK